MEIQVNRKTIRKKRRGLAPLRYDLREEPGTLKELLQAMVREEVRRYNEAQEAEGLLSWLSEEELEEQGMEGKVSFTGSGGKAADPQRAEAVMLEAFRDGLFRVLIDEREYTELEEPLTLREDSVVTVIRLSFLAGRMW